MSIKDSLETQINSQNSELLEILNQTFKNIKQNSQNHSLNQDLQEKFEKEFRKNIDELTESQLEVVQYNYKMSKTELCDLLINLLNEKPVPQYIEYKVSLPAPSLFTIKELQELNFIV